MVKVMHRIDPVIRRLKGQLQSETNEEARAVIEQNIVEREKFLTPMYHQVAVHFADLHDTPERMHEKGVINVSIVLVFFM